MANVKITELSSATTLGSSDVFPVVDVGSTQTKKVTVTDLLRNTPDGTAGAPSIANAGDQDTGIYFPAENNVGMSTGGTQRLVIDSSGRVGIGTTSPGALLDLGTSTPILRFSDSDTTGYHQIQSSNSNFIINADPSNETASSAISFKVDNSEAARIDSSGRLLVGTSTSLAGGNKSIQLVDTGVVRTILGRDDSTVSAGNAIGSLDWYGNGGDGSTWEEVASIQAEADGSHATGDKPGRLVFSTTADGASSSTERMRIDSSGRVGIGTTSPDALLNLESTTSASLRIKNTQNSTPSVPHIELLNNNNEGLDITINRSGVDSRARFAADTAISVETGGSERLRIDSSGRLLVGTTTAGSMNGGTIVAGDQLATTGSVALTTAYTSTDTINIFGSAYSSANTLIGFGVRSSTTTFNKFLSTIDNISLKRGALQVGGELIYSNAAAQNTAVGSEVTLTERFRIDNSGNVGINTSSPSAKLEISKGSPGGTSVVNGVGDALLITDNASNGISILTPNNSHGSLFFGDGDDNFVGGLRYYHGDDYLGIYANNSERMRIDSSGNVGIGTTSPNSYSGYTALTLNNATTGGLIDLEVNGTRTGTFLASATQVKLGSITSAFLRFDTNNTERMRVRSSGELLVNTTTTTVNSSNFGTRIGGTGTSIGVFITSRNVGSGGEVAIFYGQSGELQVKGDGDCENTNNRYTGISDIKLKENVVDASSQWDDIKALQVRHYNFKEETGYSTHKQIGLIAQEVETVCPGLVGETNDTDDELNETGTVTKSVAYSVLYMKAVKALQEAMDRIETLETQNASLEARLTALEGGS